MREKALQIMLYDGSFDGLLTAIFEVFEYKYDQVKILPNENYQQDFLFSEMHSVITQLEKSKRVLSKLEENLGKKGLFQLMLVYFSEKYNKEDLILFAVKYSLKYPQKNILGDYATPEIMEISKICRAVGREIHRMKAFVRFEKLQDEVFFAKIEPEFDVLSLIINHFRKRYADQKWMIFDVKRHYGILYNLEEVEFFYPQKEHLFSIKNSRKLHHEEEKSYQKLWQRYFLKTNISERKNTKLHLQGMPKKYWKYLTEKLL